jgi:formate/nitrite transporter FocA (FNT family)
MAYMLSGLLQNKVTLLDCVRVIGLATLGNIVGGVAFSWLVWERE